jgi:hypothetical protein
MCELKVYTQDEILDSSIGDDVYLQPDVDKILAEKDKKIAELNDKLRHIKYKRCLAIARWCETQFAYYIASCDRYDSKYVNKKAGHFYKWKYKWLELAEKFKGTK